MNKPPNYGDQDHHYSLDTQLRICAAMVQDHTNFMLYRDVIQPEYFEHAVMADIIRMVVGFHEKYDRLPTGDELGQQMIDLLADDGRKPVDQYVEMLERVIMLEGAFDFARDKAIDFAKHQAMANAILSGVELLKKRKYERIEESIRDALKVGDVLMDLGVDHFADLDARLKRRREGADRLSLAIPTGLAEVDCYLGGGIAPTEMGIIMAYTKVGKTITSINIGEGALTAGHNVAHIVMEGGQDTIQAGYDSKIAGVPKRQLKEYEAEVKEAYTRFFANSRHGRLFIKHFTTNTCSARTIETYLHQLRLLDNFIPGLLIIDYLGLMVMGDRAAGSKLMGHMYHKYVGEMAKEVMELGQRYGYASWLIHQSTRQQEGVVNDEGERKGRQQKKTLRMSDSSASLEPMQHATLVITLNQTDAEAEAGRIRIYLAGTREGGMGKTCEFGIDKEKTRIYELDKEVPV